jgi:NAD(P)-dependent dehydrogenase (short-subunit alcohol dehydrogenase family)
MSNLTIKVAGKTAFVTGANRGIGRAIVIELLERGAAKVYAGARKTESLSDLKKTYGDRLVPIQLDVTNATQIAAASALANDVQILINNAGLLNFGGFFTDSAIESFNKDLDVNVHGLVNVTRAFIDTLRQQSQAAIVNVSSLAGLGNMPVIGTYSTTKAAVHSITQGFRGELAKENILVTGVYPGPIDTEMTAAMAMDKDSPENVAKAVVDGIENGAEDVFPDQMSVQAGQGYSTSPKDIEKAFAAYVG